MSIRSTIQQIHHPLFDQHQLKVSVKRDDTIHPIISGNKWRKLQGNLAYLTKQSSLKGALSFGGSYSNHIHAFAYACFEQGIPCVGVIRGEAEYANNFTLSWALHWGMKLHFVDRKTYRRRQCPEFLAELQSRYPNYFIIPEGGSNQLALSGVAEIISELAQQTEYDTLMTPVGSGGTLAGLIVGDKQFSSREHKLLGISVLKGADYLMNDIEALISTQAIEQSGNHSNWRLLSQYHGGGYAKFSSADYEKILEFNKITGITFEPIYSGKMVLALVDLITQGYFGAGEHIVLLHTGGLQSLGGMIERNLLSSDDWSVPAALTNPSN